MPETRINSTQVGDFENTETIAVATPMQTDAATEQKETTWINEEWSNQLGLYKEIPELRAVIDAKATWTIGKGFKADEETEMLLDTIKGNGKDTFNTILENQIRVMLIAGDSYAEIIRDDEENLINIKPLDNGAIKIVANRQGRIIRYEQVTKVKSDKVAVTKFSPDEIFHLSRNRVADEIHGISMIDSLKWIILAKKETQEVSRTLMRRQVKPIMVFHLDTDDTKEIASFKEKMDKAYTQGENIYIPKDVVVPEVLSISGNQVVSSLPWLEYLDNQFYKTSGVPQIILGGVGGLTEAAVKIAYLAFQQTTEEDQLYIEEQSISQLNVEFELEFPASIENELLSDKKKDGAVNIDASETTAGAGQ